MNPNSQLISIIEGCLKSHSVSASEHQLLQYSARPSFVSQLLQLVPNQRPQILIMIISTLKNFVQEHYNQSQMPEDQKKILRENIFNFFYEINSCHQAVNLYKDIVYVIVSADFESFRPLFDNLLRDDLEGPIMASVYFCHQVARCYEWFTYDKRQPFEDFVATFYPRLESLIEQILTNYNEQSRVFLNELLSMFYASFHIEVPHYLRNYQNLDKWLLYFKTVLQAPLNDYPGNHTLVSRIYVKLFSMYCRDGTDGKQYRGWGSQFRARHAQNLYNQVVAQLINPLPDEDTVANIVSCLCTVAENVDLRPLMQEDHCQAIIYKYLLPFMHSSNEDNSFFNADGLEYIRRKEDLTLHPFRTAALELIKNITTNMAFRDKSELIKFVEHSANTLGGNHSDADKEVILVVLTELRRLVMKNKYLRDNFENLTRQYFIPLLNCSNEAVVAATIGLLQGYLELTTLSTETIRELLGILYEKMTGSGLVVKFYAMVTFTKLLDDKNALDQTRPHFQTILEIYVKMMDAINHEKLILSLETVVKSFSTEISMFGKDLSAHLFSLFHTYHNKEEEGQGEDQGENNQATAALSTIKQILDSPLSPESYYAISENVLILLKNLSEYDDYFEDIINLFNTLAYRSSNIADFQFPYLLFFKLLEGNNGILGNCQNSEYIGIVSQTEQADTEYAEVIISILKNLIQKMPEPILFRYPYPVNPEILLCLIENKKIPGDMLGGLNLSGIDRQWALILESYTSFIYGVGQICDLGQLKMLNGVSLYPWIEQRMGLDVLKRVLFVMEQEEAEDGYYEENTMQMLEQLAEEEDDDDNGDEFYVSDGGNYAFNYDSPFDSCKDRGQVVAKLRQLSSQDMAYLVSQLTPRFKTKLEALMNTAQ